ncbi:MAG: hypothetical protein K6F00_11770 [Lachnospiraceae bacterium]|nr:hypothetical protein [Lachnospiraceae bacterium]
MNTKQIPIIIVLLSAGIVCVISIVQGAEFSVFFRRFVTTVLIFTVVGTIVKILLDQAFGTGEEDEETGDEVPEGEEGKEETEGEETTDTEADAKAQEATPTDTGVPDEEDDDEDEDDDF